MHDRSADGNNFELCPEKSWEKREHNSRFSTIGQNCSHVNSARLKVYLYEQQVVENPFVQYRDLNVHKLSPTTTTQRVTYESSSLILLSSGSICSSYVTFVSSSDLQQCLTWLSVSEVSEGGHLSLPPCESSGLSAENFCDRSNFCGGVAVLFSF